MKNLNGKVAVVTGASNGIGAAAARALAAEGADIMVGYNTSAERAQAVVESLPKGRHRICQIVAEKADSIAAAEAAAREAYGKVDILVNSAGFTKPIAHANLDALTDDLFDQMLTVNVRGPFSIIRAFAPLMKASGDAVVVNVSSISGFTGSGSSVAYCACKGALDTMTLALARALGPEIRVLCVSPGAVATDFVAGRDRAALEKLAQATPLKRVIEPEDVADAIVACAMHLRSSTGGRIIVDGGRFLV